MLNDLVLTKNQASHFGNIEIVMNLVARFFFCSLLVPLHFTLKIEHDLFWHFQNNQKTRDARRYKLSASSAKSSGACFAFCL